MGLDATVRCRCWEDGLCTPTRLKAHISLDAESNDLSINLSWNTHSEEIQEFDRWISHACDHPEMNQIRERIGNWARVSGLRTALATAGEGDFVNLLRELPRNNGGLTFPNVARHCLEELDHFERMDAFGRRVELVDSNTGSIIAVRVDASDGRFMWLGSSGNVLSLEADGHLCVRHAESGIVFRAKKFDQGKALDGQFIYTNLADGTSCVLPEGLRDLTTSEYPPTLEGVVMSDHPHRYASSLEALRRVFLVAIDVNHPVSWC